MGSLCSAPAQDNSYKDVTADVLVPAEPAGQLDAALLGRYQSLLAKGSEVLAQLQSFEPSIGLVREALRSHDPAVEEQAYESTKRTARILLQYVEYRDSLVACMPLLLDLANEGPASPFAVSTAQQASNEARFSDPLALQALRLLSQILVQVCKMDICFLRNGMVSDLSFFKRFCTTRKLDEDDPLFQLASNKTITLTIAVPAPTLSMVSKGLTGGTSSDGGAQDDGEYCHADCDCACGTGDCGCGCNPFCPCHKAKRPTWFFAPRHEYRAPGNTVQQRAAALLNFVKFLIVKSEDSPERAAMRRECIVSATILLNSLYFEYETQFCNCAPDSALGVFAAALSVNMEALVSAVGATSDEGSLVKNCLSDAARKASATRPDQAAPMLG